MIIANRISIAERLDQVSVRIPAGKVTAICGPNGAGKSTLLAALAGLIQPDMGGVSLCGSDIAQMGPKTRARAVGFLPQSGEVAWDVSVENVVRLGRLPHGDEGAGAVSAAMRACSCEHLAERALSTLSGGEKARVLLARVLAGEPGFVLADEPFAALDLAQQHRMEEVIRGQASQGRGVAVVVHDLALARNVADHVIILEHGRVAADGPADDVLSAEHIARIWGAHCTWTEVQGRFALVGHGL